MMDLKPGADLLTAGTKPGAEMTPAQKDRLRQACSDMESLFLNNLLKSLRQLVPDGGLLPQSAGKEIYESMFETQMSIALSQGEGMGLGRMLYDQILRQREGKSSGLSSGIGMPPGDDRVRSTGDADQESGKPAGSLEPAPGPHSQPSSQEKDFNHARSIEEFIRKYTDAG